MKIVGLVGPKGSGKDTSYELLKELKKVDGKISFAGPLKLICTEVFGLHANLLNDADLKEKPMKEPITLTLKHIRKIRDLCEEYVEPVLNDGTLLYRSNAISVAGLEGLTFKTPRELMQVIGTELIRDRVYKGWHRNAAFSTKALSKLKQNGTYAVTDVRFFDENEFLTEKFGDDYQAYYVARPEAEANLEKATHPSELETKKIREVISTTNIIDNSGDLEELKTQLGKLTLKVPKSTKPKEPGSRFKYTAR